MEGPRVAAASATAREPPFELTFRLGGADYQAFLRTARRRGLERLVTELPAVALAVLGAFLGYFLVAAAGRGDEPAWIAPAALVGALVLFVLGRFMLMPAYQRSVFTGQLLALGEVKVVIDTRGVGANMAEIVLAMPWSSVQRMVETDQHVFLIFARLVGIIVPKRAFASADQAKRFVAFARSMATGART